MKSSRKGRNLDPYIAYVGALHAGSTALHRWAAVKTLAPGYRHCGVDISPWFQQAAFRGRSFRLMNRIAARMGRSCDLRRVAAQITAAASCRCCRLLWLDKTIDLDPAVLSVVRRNNPNIRIVFYTPDDMANPGNKTSRFLRSLPLYDLVVTTKSFQIDELKGWGAKDVQFVDNAYDPDSHRPESLTDADQARFGCDIGFVGAYEADRAAVLIGIAQRGFEVKVWSYNTGWPRIRIPGFTLESEFVHGESYRKAIGGSKIQLGFLRKANRDLQTQRSIEIPACGGFMLAERTDEHRRLFVEGREAEFFGDFDELVRKARYYLSAEAERKQIAAAGLERCRRAGYTNRERLAPVIGRFLEDSIR